MPDISTSIKKSDYDKKIIEIEKNIKKLQTFDSSYFRGKNCFEEVGAQNYLVFQPIFKSFKINIINNAANYVLLWKSKGLSDETIKPPATSDNSLAPALSYYYPSKIRVKFTGTCLKQDKTTYTHKTSIKYLYCL